MTGSSMRLLVGTAAGGVVPVAVVDAEGRATSVTISAENAISAAHGLLAQGRAVIARPEEWQEALDKDMG